MGSGLSGSKGSSYKIKASPSAKQVVCVEWIIPPKSRLSMLPSEFVPQTMIGKGKFGNVFLTKHVSTGQYCAVKYILKQAIFDNKADVRIQQEIDIIQKIKHPFTVHFFGGFETEGCIALAFEYVPGGELYTRMKKENPMSEDHAMFYFCEIALALKYLQTDLGIVYRDLKPENVLLDCGGHVKLCDFGFAVPLGSDNESLNDGCGTAMYVAPEIAEGFMKRRHGFPVDWWSLGCVLYEMVVGTPPFGDTDNMSKFEIFNNINANAVSLPFRMSPALKVLIKGLLDKSPDRRYTWMEIRESEWVGNVPWDSFEKRKIIPPWVPNIPVTATTEHFVSWSDPIDPNFPATTLAANYCKTINLPHTRQTMAGGTYLSKSRLQPSGRGSPLLGVGGQVSDSAPSPLPPGRGQSTLVLGDGSMPSSFSPGALPALKVKRSNSRKMSRRGSENFAVNGSNETNGEGSAAADDESPSRPAMSKQISSLGNVKRVNSLR